MSYTDIEFEASIGIQIPDPDSKYPFDIFDVALLSAIAEDLKEEFPDTNFRVSSYGDQAYIEVNGWAQIDDDITDGDGWGEVAYEVERYVKHIADSYLFKVDYEINNWDSDMVESMVRSNCSEPEFDVDAWVDDYKLSSR